MINKYKFPRKKVKAILDDNKHPLRKKLKLRTFFNRVYSGKLYIVPEEDVDKFLTEAVKEKGIPLGFDSGYDWIKKRVYGIPKRRWRSFLKGLESWQLLKARKVKNPDPKPDVTMTVLKKGKEKRIGFDLIQIGQNKGFRPGFISGVKYILVVCDKMTRFCWATCLTGKTAKKTMAGWKKLLPDIRRKIGREFSSESDRGKEFVSIVKTRGGRHHYVKLSSFVESTNSLIMRYAVMLSGGFKKKETLPELLPQVLKKINNIPHRRTKVTPVEGISQDHEELYKVRKKTSKSTGVRASTRTKMKVGDYVRFDTSNPKDGFYKSWVGLKKIPPFQGQEIQTKYKPHWSKIFKIRSIRPFGGSLRFFVHRNWYFLHQLQKVPGPTARKFNSTPKKERPKAKKKKKPVIQRRVLPKRKRAKPKRYTPSW